MVVLIEILILYVLSLVNFVQVQILFFAFSFFGEAEDD
jgi:hypothetical protein